MNIHIRKAQSGEGPAVLDFYNDLIEGMKGAQYPIRWVKDVYPVLDDIQKAIDEESLYIALVSEDDWEEKIIGAFILNHFQSEGYELVKWKVAADPKQVAVLHLLATSPACQGHGLGHRMLSEAVRLCQSEGDKAIRLDTLTWNVPGKALYEHFGFTYCGDISLYYPTTGDLPFSMYEYSLSDSEAISWRSRYHYH